MAGSFGEHGSDRPVGAVMKLEVNFHKKHGLWNPKLLPVDTN